MENGRLGATGLYAIRNAPNTGTVHVLNRRRRRKEDTATETIWRVVTAQMDIAKVQTKIWHAILTVPYFYKLWTRSRSILAI